MGISFHMGLTGDSTFGHGCVLLSLLLLTRDLFGSAQIAKLPDHKTNTSANQHHDLKKFQHRDALSADSFALFQTAE
jgi:hypothetical protein